MAVAARRDAHDEGLGVALPMALTDARQQLHAMRFTALWLRVQASERLLRRDESNALPDPLLPLPYPARDLIAAACGVLGFDWMALPPGIDSGSLHGVQVAAWLERTRRSTQWSLVVDFEAPEEMWTWDAAQALTLAALELSSNMRVTPQPTVILAPQLGAPNTLTVLAHTGAKALLCLDMACATNQCACNRWWRALNVRPPLRGDRTQYMPRLVR